MVQQLFFILVMTTNNSILQSVTPDYMRGRVMGIYMLDIGMQPLGGVVAGVLATVLQRIVRVDGGRRGGIGARHRHRAHRACIPSSAGVVPPPDAASARLTA